MDLSQAKISIEIEPIDPLVGKSGQVAQSMQLDLGGLSVYNRTTLNEIGNIAESNYSAEDKQGIYLYSDPAFYSLSGNGYTTTYKLPQGTYRIKEINTDKPMVINGAPYKTLSITYTYGDQVVSDSNGIEISLQGNSNSTIILSNDYDLTFKSFSSENFIFKTPDKLNYNNEKKVASVTPKDNIKNDVSSIKIKYFRDNKELKSEPVDAGTYTVKINVTSYEGSSYPSIEDLTDDAWNFTVSPFSINDNDKVTLDENNTHLYDGKVWNPIVKLNGVDLIAEMDYKLTLPDDMISIGNKEITVEFMGNYDGKLIFNAQILPDTSSWGVKTEHSTTNRLIENYIHPDGTTSAIVRKNAIIWLKEKSGNKSAWYGLDNTNSVFKEGSRFWVRWLNKETDSRYWEEYYSMLDENHKNSVESEKLWVFLCGVTDPDGNEYTTLTESTDLYIQLGDSWDKDDINAVFISDAHDEILDVSYLSNFPGPDGEGEYARIKLNHFSPYAVYDDFTTNKEKDIELVEDAEDSTDSLYEYITGDITGLMITLLLITVVFTAMLLVVAFRKNKLKN